MAECKHEDIKYFEKYDHAVCLKCGRIFGHAVTQIEERIEYKYIYVPQTTYPKWPQIYCSTTSDTGRHLC